MPTPFKKHAPVTDASVMSETSLTELPDPPSMLPDGEAPRLATGPLPTPATTPQPPSEFMAVPDASTFELPADAPSLPMTSPVLGSVAAPSLPDPGSGAVPVLTDASDPTDAGDQAGDQQPADPAHPMAHLMPPKSAATEASRRAAEKRAAKKAKAKKVKYSIIAGFIVVTVALGPPMFKWFTNALDEAGTTGTTEQPDG